MVTDRQAGWIRVPREVIGLTAAVAVFLAIATTFAFQSPPFLAPDETAHLGYAQEIAHFDLPEIDREPEVPANATQWQAERESGRDDRYRAVWVANHPPLYYATTAPLIWFGNLTDRADGGLMLLRLANTAYAAVGIVFTYLFTLEATRGARRIALAAAALVAFLPQGHALFSAALNDGFGFAAGGLLLWVAARCLRRGPTTANLVLLGVASAVAWGARTSTMLLSFVVVGFVAAAQWFTASTRAQRLRSGAVVVGLGLGPAAVAFGWFYVRIWALYGDPGASEFLLERFRRRTKGSVFDVMTWGHLWVDLYHKLLSPSPVFAVKAPPGTNIAAAVALIGLVVALVAGRTGDRPRGAAPWELRRRTVALGIISVVAISGTVAQHVSGGGNAYGRYLFPVLPVLALIVAVGFDRLVPRALPAIGVAALAIWAWRNVPTSVDVTTISRPRDRDGMPEALRIIPSSEWSRDLLIVLGAGGTVVLGLVVLLGAFRVRPGAIRRAGAKVFDRDGSELSSAPG